MRRKRATVKVGCHKVRFGFRVPLFGTRERNSTAHAPPRWKDQHLETSHGPSSPSPSSSPSTHSRPYIPSLQHKLDHAIIAVPQARLFGTSLSAARSFALTYNAALALPPRVSARYYFPSFGLLCLCIYISAYRVSSRPSSPPSCWRGVQLSCAGRHWS